MAIRAGRPKVLDKRAREIETGPGGEQLGHHGFAGHTRLGHEVGRRQNDAFAHDTVEAERNAVEVGQGRHERRSSAHEVLRRARVVRGHADPVGDELARRVQHRGLEAGAADVDRERRRAQRGHDGSRDGAGGGLPGHSPRA